MPELVTRIAVGDRTAFAAFYDLLAPRVFRLVVSAVGDGEAACEVTRDVFGDMWIQAARLPTDARRLLVWAMGIAYQHARQRAETPHRNHGKIVNRFGPNTNAVGVNERTDHRSPSGITLSYYGALAWTKRPALPRGQPTRSPEHNATR